MLNSSIFFLCHQYYGFTLWMLPAFSSDVEIQRTLILNFALIQKGFRVDAETILKSFWIVLKFKISLKSFWISTENQNFSEIVLNPYWYSLSVRYGHAFLSDFGVTFKIERLFLFLTGLGSNWIIKVTSVFLDTSHVSQLLILLKSVLTMTIVSFMCLFFFPSFTFPFIWIVWQI